MITAPSSVKGPQPLFILMGEAERRRKGCGYQFPVKAIANKVILAVNADWSGKRCI